MNHEDTQKNILKALLSDQEEARAKTGGYLGGELSWP